MSIYDHIFLLFCFYKILTQIYLLTMKYKSHFDFLFIILKNSKHHHYLAYEVITSIFFNLMVDVTTWWGSYRIAWVWSGIMVWIEGGIELLDPGRERWSLWECSFHRHHHITSSFPSLSHVITLSSVVNDLQYYSLSD